MNKDEFYISFENKFRGTREQIINSFCNYEGSLNYCFKNYANLKVLDIVCGRGEWLQKLKQLGLDGTGIEINSKMVEYCNGLELDVLEDDEISLMASFEDQTFAIISIILCCRALEF